MRFTDQFEKEHDISLFATTYAVNGNMALMAFENEEPYACLTDNFGKVPHGFAFMNDDKFPEIIKELVDMKIAIPTGIYNDSGYCTYHLYRFDLHKLKENASITSTYRF